MIDTTRGRRSGRQLTPADRGASCSPAFYENVDLDLADKVKEFMETLQSDPFGGLPGYRGSMTLIDRGNARLVGIGFYASAGQAQEADALLTTMPDTLADQVPATIRPALDMRPDSVGLYEIVQRD